MLAAIRHQRFIQQQQNAAMNSAIDLLVDYGLDLCRKITQRRKRTWVRKWIERRDARGGGLLLNELRLEDPTSFINIMRMDSTRFDELLGMIANSIQREDTQMRKALPARLKLEVTLRYLATGDSFKSLSYFFRVPVSSISCFIPEVLTAIITALSSFLKCPTTENEWNAIARQFNVRWNFPHCVAAIDGKHVSVKQPPCSGSKFFNYKGFYSTILLALVDGNYNFIYVNTGSNGARNDAGIFRDSQLFKALEENTLNLPSGHVIVGDSAFPLKEYMMKPYSCRHTSSKQHVFNYRLSRARRIVENAFGILAWRFRVFQRPIELKLGTVDDVVFAACSLHNWLRANNPSYITSKSVDMEDANTGELIPGEWRAEVKPWTSGVSHGGSNNYTRNAEELRRKYTRYFWCDAPIPSQWKAVGLDPCDVLTAMAEDESEEDDLFSAQYLSHDSDSEGSIDETV